MSVADWAVLLGGVPLALLLLWFCASMIHAAFDGDEEAQFLIGLLVFIGCVIAVLYGIFKGGLWFG